MKLTTLIRSPLRLAVALAGVLALSAGIGVASGAIPSSSGRIYGCFGKAGGNLRVIDKAKHQQCNNGEQALAFNQQGQKGDRGVPGPQGPKGDTGRLNLAIDTAAVNVAPGASADASVPCPANQQATGGGFAATGVRNTASQPSFRDANGAQVPVGWSASFQNDSGQTVTALVEVICAS